ncbi:hypothetical protein SAMN03159463_05085 [Mesorhizobium sp. NFR06]|nr:hypothetical protein SAMN03159463_05085 [Mesorhizobium sp. NFR06]
MTDLATQFRTDPSMTGYQTWPVKGLSLTKEHRDGGDPVLTGVGDGAG